MMKTSAIRRLNRVQADLQRNSDMHATNNREMKMRKNRPGLTALFMMLVLAGGGSQAAAPKATVKPSVSQPASTRTEVAPPMQLIIGKSTILRLPAPAERISLGNPAIADVTLINPREIYLLGKDIGSTNMIVWSRNGVATVMDITVNIDKDALQTRMRQIMPNEQNIEVDVAFDSVILKGEVSDAVKADQAVSIADAFVRKFNRSLVTDVQMPGSDRGVNVSLSGGRDSTSAVRAAGARIVNMLRIRAPQQVMLEVKIAEINRTMAEKLGFDFARQLTGGGGAWTKVISGIIGGGAANYNKNINATQKIGTADLTLSGPLNSAITLPIQVPGGTPGFPTLTVPAGAPAEVDLINGMLQQTKTDMSTQDFTKWLVDAQKTDGLVKILAEPNIVAISGQEGRFLAGGEIMIPVTGRDGEVTLESKEFGVGLSFTPTVLEEGRINIKVLSGVTELINLSPATFSGRKVATTVQLRDGQSLAIGGLLQDNFREQVKRFPFLGEIPIIGALFRSSEFQKNKTELLIVVTPRLIKPLAPDYVLPTDGFVEPSRSEFLFEGKMEGRKSQDGQSGTGPAADRQPASGGFEMK